MVPPATRPHLRRIDSDGNIVGTAESEPNHGDPGAHVAAASFIVDRTGELTGELDLNSLQINRL
jgi:hypothetical protein